MENEIKIAGHADEWVALVNNKVVAHSSSFKELARKLEAAKLLNKVIVTHVSGTNIIL